MAVPIKTYGRKLISKNTPDIWKRETKRITGFEATLLTKADVERKIGSVDLHQWRAEGMGMGYGRGHLPGICIGDGHPI